MTDHTSIDMGKSTSFRKSIGYKTKSSPISKKKSNQKKKKLKTFQSPDMMNLYTTYEPCVHLHFKTEVVDRERLSHDQYLDMLATPKGYRWLGEADFPNSELVINKKKKKKKQKKEEPPVIRQDPGDFADEFVEDMWDVMSPEITDRLMDFLVNEFGMSIEEAEDFIDCKGASGKQTVCKKKKSKAIITFGVKHKWVKEFSDVFAKRIEQYIVSMLLTRRTQRGKRIAERILGYLCDLTGEKTTLQNPKTKIQKTIVLFADRLALWIEDLMKDIDKTQIKRPSITEEEEEIPKSDKEEKEEPSKPEEEKQKTKEEDEKSPDKALDEEEKEEPSKSKEEKEEDEKSPDKTAEEKGQEAIDKEKETDKGESKTDEKQEEPKAEGTLKEEEKPEDKTKAEDKTEDKKIEEITEGKQDEEKKEEPTQDGEPKEEKKEEEAKPKEEEKKEETKQDGEPEKITDEGTTDEAKKEGEKTEDEKQEDKQTEEGEKTEDEKQEDKPQEEGEKTEDEKQEDKPKEEETKQDGDPEKITDEGTTDEAKKEEEKKTEDKKPEDKPSRESGEEKAVTEEKEKKPQVEESDKPKETRKTTSREEKILSKKELITPSCVVEKKPVLDYIKDDILGTVKDEKTDKHEAIKDAIDRRLEAMLSGKDYTPEDTDDAASRIAHWVEDIMKATEPGREPYKSPGPAFVIKAPRGSTIEVQKLSSGTVAEATAQARGVAAPPRQRKIPASTSPINVKSAQEWVDWATNVANVADEWGKWLDTKLTDVEKQVEEKKKGSREKDWKTWREEAGHEAMQWRAEKERIRGEGKLWGKKLDKTKLEEKVNPKEPETEVKLTTFTD